MGSVVEIESGLPVGILTERALSRVTIVRKRPLPDEIETPWVCVTRRFARGGNGELNRRYFIIIPRARVREFAGEKISTRDAALRAELVLRVSDDTRHTSHLRAMDRLIKTPAPASYDEGWGSTRRRYCEAHCSKCGLHFTSNGAFDEHVRERHRHPSKSERLVPVEGVDTGCYNMGTAYDDTLAQMLPFYNQSYRHVPGVRLWEHVRAQTVREHFASERASSR